MSKSTRTLVLGAGGLLGSHVMDSGKALQLDIEAQTTERFLSGREVADYLDSKAPISVVNCVGYKGSDEAMHYRINGCFPRAVADWCDKRSALMVHVSTNAVFAPDDARQWLPDDRAEPGTAYEISKAFGEDPRAWILRASFVGLFANRAGLLNDLVHGRPYWNRAWNGVTASVLADRIASIVAATAGQPTSRIEHVHSRDVMDMRALASKVGSPSECLGDRADARLLSGGLMQPDFASQLQHELNTYGPAR